ncbi:hypothetical protein FOL47_010746 [Perkinsus chesapeaki]|uniref:RNA helicase n=1 Tax=Perkinsus chesapeaki TaxID=330153 RepID=A0A7J6MP13_PERCH|nr:hypothetical protein FOL47_010746 [Perkinsus chesapeaki]
MATPEDASAPLLDPALLGLDADSIEGVGGTNNLIMPSGSSKAAVKKQEAPKEKMSKRKRKKLMELQQRAEREAKRLAVLDELKSHQLSSAEKAKMHAVADTGVRRRRRDDSVGLAKLEKKRQKLAELAELSDGDVEPPSKPKPVRGVPRKITAAHINTGAQEPLTGRLKKELAPVRSKRPTGPTYPRIHVHRSVEIEKQRANLPAVMMETEIVDCVMNADEGVSIVCGDTGCGKSTQVPQFIYETGVSKYYGKLIGMTQPRRVAATSVAKRISEELGPDQDGVVGYQVRYDKSMSPDKMQLKVMTDGILMREIQSDFLLTKYCVIIIDEAHERSINCDILLGMISRAITMRAERSMPPLRLVIMSATLRLTDFTQNAELFPKPPPVVQIDARTHPVTVHFERRTEQDYIKAAVRKVRLIHAKLPRGSILVFVTGKSEIYEMCEALGAKPQKKKESHSQYIDSDQEDEESDDDESDDKNMPDATPESDASSSPPPQNTRDEKSIGPAAFKLSESEQVEQIILEKGCKKASSSSAAAHKGGSADFIGSAFGSGRLVPIPLYAQMSTTRQAEAFRKPRDDERFVIIATNVAETALTLPNIRYVVDTGREKKRVYRNDGVSMFKVGFCASSSADQRAGRAGRVGPGHCYRLYSGAVYGDTMPDFPLPEIASGQPLDDTVLMMAKMGIPRFRHFPWPTPPPAAAVIHAVTSLSQLGAVHRIGISNDEVAITQTGEAISNFPVAPRHGCMLIHAAHLRDVNSPEWRDVLIMVVCVVAALTVGDIFVPPPQEKVDADKVKLPGWSKCHSDIEALLWSLGGYMWTKPADQDVFCVRHRLRSKALSEAASLSRQLLAQMDHFLGLTDAEKIFKCRPRPPTPQQLALVHESVTRGLIDHVACKSTLDTRSYLAPGHMVIYIHRESLYYRRRPSEFAYTEIIKASDSRGKNVARICVAVDTDFLARLDCPELVKRGTPLKMPPPFYSASSDKVTAHFTPVYIPLEMPLPTVGIELSTLDPLSFKVFACAILQGKVFPKLLKYRSSLISQPTMEHARLLPLVESLRRSRCGSRRELEKLWLTKPDVLRIECESWYNKSVQKAIEKMWPPVDVDNSDHMGLWQQSMVKCADNCGIFKAVIIVRDKVCQNDTISLKLIAHQSREYRGEKLPRGIINAFIAISNNKPLGNKVKGPVTYECGSGKYMASQFLLDVPVVLTDLPQSLQFFTDFVAIMVVPASSKAKTDFIRFGGVPEHFNAPFQRLLQRQSKAAAAADGDRPQLAWRTYPGGSGAMLNAVISKEVDCACVLTESAVAHIIKNADSKDGVKILGTYVASPLVWGVHASANRPEDSKSNIFGISRMGSGSHIMAQVDSENDKSGQNDPGFKVVNSLDGAVESMAKGDIDYFMWEVFTTKHLVDRGEWQLVRKVPAPWPAFVFVVRNDIPSERLAATKEIIHMVYEQIEDMLNDREKTLKFISQLYNMSLEDTENWMKDVKWQCDTQVDYTALGLARDVLRRCGIIDKETDATPDDLVVTGSCALVGS